MSVLDQSFAPFVYLARLHQVRPVPFTVDGPGTVRCYNLWLLKQGTAQLTQASSGRSHLLHTGGVALCEPGFTVELQAGACGWQVVFDLFWAGDRRRHPGGHFVVEETGPPQPAWQTFCDARLPLPLPPEVTPLAVRTVQSVRSTYWLDEWAHVEANCSLGLLVAAVARLQGGESPWKGSGLARAAQRMILDRYAMPGGIAEIAALLGVSASALSRAFGDHFGFSPRRLLEDLRLKQAQELLLTTDAPIAIVATTCCYGSRASFTRAFKRAFGKTPREWRMAERGS